MREPERRNEDEYVPLVIAGFDSSEIDRQLERLRHSEALEGKHSEKKLLELLVRESRAGRVQRLRVAEITKTLFRKYTPGDSRVRGDAKKLREHLDDYYASEAKAGEIRFTIPPKQYVIYAPRAAAAITEPRTSAAEAHPVASIIEPAENAEVYQRITVRGRIDRLDPDLRAWLVVRTPGGDLYPQCRVRRKTPEWEEEVRIGRLQWGTDEGAIYEIDLVAADADGDAAFFGYLRANQDGFGPMLPTDCEVLAVRPVTRRDLRKED